MNKSTSLPTTAPIVNKFSSIHIPELNILKVRFLQYCEIKDYAILNGYLKYLEENPTIPYGVYRRFQNNLVEDLQYTKNAPYRANDLIAEFLGYRDLSALVREAATAAVNSGPREFKLLKSIFDTCDPVKVIVTNPRRRSINGGRDPSPVVDLIAHGPYRSDDYIEKTVSYLAFLDDNITIAVGQFIRFFSELAHDVSYTGSPKDLLQSLARYMGYKNPNTIKTSLLSRNEGEKLEFEINNAESEVRPVGFFFNGKGKPFLEELEQLVLTHTDEFLEEAYVSRGVSRRLSMEEYKVSFGLLCKKVRTSKAYKSKVIHYDGIKTFCRYLYLWYFRNFLPEEVASKGALALPAEYRRATANRPLNIFVDNNCKGERWTSR
jgi:hypothetical protein